MSSVAVVLICVVLGALALFQGSLALGAPLGRFAWGGQHRVLPVSLRLGSLVSILIYAIIAAIVLARAETITYGIPSSIFGIAIWVVAAYFFVAIALNLASKSTSERAVMPVVSAVLCVLCIVVALR